MTYHFSGCRLALFLGHLHALWHPFGDALMGLDLLVLRLPHGGIGSPALWLMAAAMLRFARGSGSQADASDNEKVRQEKHCLIQRRYLRLFLPGCLCDVMEKLGNWWGLYPTYPLGLCPGQ